VRIWSKAASKESPSAGHHLKAVHAADPVELPGKLAEPEPWDSQSQARRQTAQGVVFLALLVVIGYYGTQVWLRGTEAANRKSCRGNLHALCLSLEMYQQDHDGRYPLPDADLAWALRPYTEGTSCLLCPSDDLARPVIRRQRVVRRAVSVSYTYLPPSGMNPEMQVDVGQTPMLWDYYGGIPTGAHRQGGNVAYLDGHVRWRPLYLWNSANQPW